MTQTVNIVEEHIEYQGDLIWGVFDTEEKAEARIEFLRDKYHSRGTFEVKDWDVK